MLWTRATHGGGSSLPWFSARLAASACGRRPLRSPQCRRTSGWLVPKPRLLTPSRWRASHAEASCSGVCAIGSGCSCPGCLDSAHSSAVTSGQVPLRLSGCLCSRTPSSAWARRSPLGPSSLILRSGSCRGAHSPSQSPHRVITSPERSGLPWWSISLARQAGVRSTSASVSFAP